MLTVTSPKEKPIAGSVGRPLPGVEVKIADPDEARRGRGDRARPQRHGRLLGRRRGHRRRGPRRLVPHRRPRPVRREGKPVPGRPVEGRHRRRQRQERLPRRGRRALRRQPVRQGAVRRRRPRRHRRAGGLRHRREPGARSGPVAGRGPRENRRALPQGVGRPAHLEARARGSLLGGRPAEERQAIGQAPRRVGGDCPPAPEDRGDEGRAGRGVRRPRAGGLAAGHGRHRVGPPPRGRAAEQPLRRAGLRQLDVRRAVERAGEPPASVLPESVDITTLGTVAELQELLARGPVAAARERAAGGADDDTRPPRSVAGRRGGQARAWSSGSSSFTSACWRRR